MNPILDVLTSPAAAGIAGVAITIVKATSILLTALLVTLAMRRAAAGARHLVWFVALASVLGLPALALWAPLPIHVLPAPVAPTLRSVANDAVNPASSPNAVAAPSAQGGAAVAGRSATVSAGGASRSRAFAARSWLVALWALGAFVLLVRLALSAWAVRRVVRRARVLDREDWQQPLYEIADRLGLDDAPRLLQSDRATIPFATGLLAPRIVLPVDSESWSRERRCAVLIHELGHVRRRDMLAHAIGRVVCALYWFHPLVWTAAKRLRIESERACDDLALALGARPSEYAEHLLDIVTQVRDQATPAVALAMANPNEFEGRMLAILNPKLRRRGLGRVQATALAACLTVVAVVIGALAPAPKAAPVRPMAADTPPLVAAREEAESSAEAEEPESRGDGVSAKESDDEEETHEARRERVRERSDDGDSDDEASDDESEGGHRVDVLARTLAKDPSAEVRRVAAWGLEHYAQSKVAAEELATAAVEDDDVNVREMAAWALSGSRGCPSAVTAIYAVFRHEKNADVRRTAAWAAGSIGDRAFVPGLVAMLGESDPDLREIAAWSIGSCNAEHAPAALVRALEDSHGEVRLSAAWALREIGDPSAADALEAAFRREKDPDVQQGLIRALGAMGDRASGTLSRLVDSKDPEVRTVAVTALAGGNAGGPWPWPRPEPRPFP